MKTKRVYVVIVRPEYAMPRISQEAYASLEGAQAFIEARGDSPKRVNAFAYEGNGQIYTIHELLVKGS